MADFKVDYEALNKHSDATRDIGVSAQKRASLTQKRATYHGNETEEPKASDFAQPGGFRRLFVVDKGGGEVSQDVVGEDKPQGRQRDYATKSSFMDQIMNVHYAFIDTVDVWSPENDPNFGIAFDARLASPLLPGAVHRKLQGINSVSQLAMIIWKGFMCSSLFYMPRLYYNAGMMPAPIVIFLSGSVTVFCCLRLVDAADEVKKRRGDQGKDEVPSFGDVCFEAWGGLGKTAVNVSLVMSQSGFAASYFILIFANTQEVFRVTVGSEYFPSDLVFMGLLAALWAPLCWIRQMRFFAIPSIIGNIFIIAVAVVMFIYILLRMVTEEALGDIDMTHWGTFPFTIGTSIYSLEGIGVVMPIYIGCNADMRAKYKKTLASVILGICVSFIVFGTLGYTAYAETTQTVFMLNMPKGSYIKTAVQIMFIFEVYFTFPLGLCPVIQILEPVFVHGSGKKNSSVKMAKNVFRTVTVAMIAAVAVFFRNQLDVFISLVGALCCMPLAIIFPAIIHYKVIKGQAVVDLACAVVGVFLMLFALYETLQAWAAN